MDFNTIYKKYEANKLFLTLYRDNLTSEYRVVYLLEREMVNNFFVKKRFVDIHNGKIITDMVGINDEEVFYIQNKSVFVNNYNIRHLININDAAIFIGYNPRDTYTNKKAQILLSNYNHQIFLKPEPETSKKLKP